MTLDRILQTLEKLFGEPKPLMTPSCIATTAAGIRVFRRFGFEAEALAVHAWFENDNWSVGTTDSTAPLAASSPAVGFEGHVVIHLISDRHHILVDLDAGTMSRPDEGLVMGSHMQWLVLNPEMWAHFQQGQAFDKEAGNGRLGYVLHADQKSWRNCHAWQNKHTVKKNAEELIALVERCEESSAAA